MGSNLVIVAIPDENDRVWKVSSEKIPHLTLLFLGEAESVKNSQQIVEFVEHAAETTLKRFYLPVDRRDELGDDKADVLFFKRTRYDFKAINEFRVNLLKDQNIKTAYDATEQFEGPWKPHLTLGYPSAPAKSGDNGLDDPFYDISFNKVAVWFGDFDGPDFLLKDYWDEEFADYVPGEMAMSSANEARVQLGLDAVEHHGTLGMKWGQRKTETVSVGGKTKMVTPKKAEKLDSKWQNNIYSIPGAVAVHNAGAEHFNARIESLNDKYKDNDFSGTKWEKPSSWTPREKEYMTKVDALSAEAIQHAVKEVHGTSPTGKLRAELNDAGDSIVVREEKIKHAAETDTETIVVLKVIRNAKGLIIGVEEMEAAMEQTAQLGAEFLEHHGVLGMKWGERKAQVRSGAQVVKKAAKTAARVGGDIYFEGKADTPETANRIANDATKNFRKEDLPKINAKPEYAAAKKLPTRLRNPRDPLVKQYRKEHREAYIKQLEKSANSLTNASGNREYTIRERGDELPAQGGNLPKSKLFWEVSTRPRKGAAQHSDDFEGTTTLEVILDDDGFITDVVPQRTTVEHGAVFAEGLAHYGTLGMKWGVRNKREAPTAVAPQAMSRVPHGTKRKTQIEVDGGENHPAAADAIKVAQARVKLAKSGPAALSNKELQDIATRIDLETRVSRATQSPAKKFVKNLLKQQGEQEIGARFNADRQQRLRTAKA